MDKKNKENGGKREASKSDNKEKKFIDKSGRVLGIISVIDVVAIFAVVALCFGVYLKNNVLTATGTEDQTMVFTFEARIVEDYIRDAIQVGDEVFDKDHSTGGAIGVITSIEVSEPRAIAELSDGSLEYITSNRGCNLLVTVEGKGAVVDGMFSFNRIYKLGVNAARNFQTKYCTMTGFVQDIYVVD